MGGAVHHGFIESEYFRGEVAVGDIENRDRDAFGDVVRLGVPRRDGGVVEKQTPIGRSRSGDGQAACGNKGTLLTRP